MKALILATLLLTGGVAQAQYTQGYTRRDGTYVQGYHHTQADGNPYNNYSTRGNVNPYTGEAGTVNPGPNSGGVNYGNPYVNPYAQPYTGSHFGE